MLNAVSIMYIYGFLTGLIYCAWKRNKNEDNAVVLIASIVGYFIIIFFKNAGLDILEKIIFSITALCITGIAIICYLTIAKENKQFKKLLDKEAKNEHLFKDVRNCVSSKTTEETL